MTTPVRTHLAPGPGLTSAPWGSGPCSRSWSGRPPSSSVHPVTSRQDRRRKSQPRASEATSAGLCFKEVHALEPHTAQQVGPPKYPFHNPRWGICKKCLLTAPRSQLRLHLLMLMAATAAWGGRFLHVTKFCQFNYSLSGVWLPATPRTAAQQASLPITNSRSSLKLMSIESVMSQSSHPMSSLSPPAFNLTQLRVLRCLLILGNWFCGWGFTGLGKFILVFRNTSTWEMEYILPYQ